jgi:hypothetical protein
MYHIDTPIRADTRMTDPLPFRRPIRWSDLRTDEAERLVRERVKVTGNVIISEHAFDQLDLRFGSILQEDVYWILEKGIIERKPIKENPTGWKVIVVKRMPGTREAGVVTLIATDNDTLFVKTVEWMDIG